jgi:CBS domain-containing protein
MFSVYGTSGQLFRGSVEQLRQIGGVSALARTGSILPVVQDGRDAESAGSLPAQGTEFVQSDPRHSSLIAYKQAQKSDRHPLFYVNDLMSRPVICLPDTATVLQAWELLAQKKIGQAPVVNPQLHLVGMLTRADVFSANQSTSPESHAQVWRGLLMQDIKTIMVTPIPSVTQDIEIRRVARVLLDTGLPGLPVIDEQGHVSGFISRSDILRAVVTDPPLDLWG